MNRARLLGLLAGAVLLAGCATGPRPVPEEPEVAWDQNRAALAGLERWRAEGRLVVRTSEDGGQAHFTWHERGVDRFSLRFAGPWGQGAARLDGYGDRVVLQAADGRRFVGTDARELLASVYGWDIPVAALRQWLIGLPTEGANYRLDRFGRVTSMQWHDWVLDYRRYRQRDGIDLPAVLTARRDAGGVELRVAVDSWRLGGEADPGPGSPIPLIGG